ncbi:Spermidine/putrescine-binding periplasmic protein 2 [Bibersteinia trehalosi USDA-ARS-USMARC-188]|uniref:Putrescine-binding periplasmic protein n=3 Tax=Bibersteinia trehalosi TaxID=47735 RepID=W0RA60_BIBTR|nr:extracellular solute-binding protein [Bibersteinia trehalosi]AGH39253.1 Spermidine/putrescine-binding periplasmic protein 2 [Bibersteinia trehalosi USDA-ARS-USMARC-192]AHG81001.1 Spermidine/putrescine-binding periplasmic protein 2 [Bibersteinia trehalosi USDA-ARS-USMARC-188]AHG83213.1 Spermidine/putrescine-binding periplasmic protein 2 [Bibersteinia trehalosi USDA-ARS-USMARC-189]AHG87185.1 Spermidine/putrescine-binding periplasmic protein 2 [Bibersteinia trehalosi USDA-ARS-USMARC-190]
MVKFGRTFFAKILATAVAFSALSAQAAEKLYVYNWTEYVPSSLLEQFQKETGIEVIYSTFESNEEMYSKLKLSNGGGYDIVFPSSYYVGKMAKEGMLAEIEHAKLSNFANVSKELMGKPFDPENKYSLPYVYGLTGIGVNTAEIDSSSLNSWGDLWRKEFKGKVLLMNDAREVFHIALLLDGKSPNTQDETEIKAAYERLQKLVPNVLVFNSDSPEMPYLQGEVAVGMQWTGSAHRAKSENPDIQFIFPKEGAVVWMDNYAIPKQAKNKEAAHKFIDFLLRPESAKEVIETMGFSMPNEAVKAILPVETVEDPLVFPPIEEIEKGILQADVGEAVDIYEKYWNLLRTQK